MFRFLFVFFVLTFNSFAQENYPFDISTFNIPKTSDAELKRILEDKSTIFYKLPQIWQHYVPPSEIEHRNLTLLTTTRTVNPMIWALYHVDYKPDSHANFNFPWETTIGLNSIKKESDSFKTFNFLNLPTDSLGKKIPILIIREYPIKWIYPVGTTVGEIIYVTHNKVNYIQEIRTRKKSVGSLDWVPNLYRPISNREEYINLTNSAEYVPAKSYMHFRNPQEDEVFKMEGLVERLPALEENKVKKLLSLPFKNVTEDNWSPSSEQDFHILPKNYCFSLLGSIDSFTCADCHRQTQISVRNLVPKDPSVINDPQGTGNIRGSDGIFTWHPFFVKTEKDNKEPTVYSNPRKYDFDNNVIKNYNEKETIDSSTYKLTQYVQNSLKTYELPKAKIVLHNSQKQLAKTNE